MVGETADLSASWGHLSNNLVDPRELQPRSDAPAVWHRRRGAFVGQHGAWVSKLWLHLSWGSRVFLKIASACWVVCFDNRPRLGMSVMSCKLWSCPKRPFDPLHRRKAAMFFSLQWLGAQQSHPSLTGFSAESLRRQDVFPRHLKEKSHGRGFHVRRWWPVAGSSARWRVRLRIIPLLHRTVLTYCNL